MYLKDEEFAQYLMKNERQVFDVRVPPCAEQPDSNESIDKAEAAVALSTVYNFEYHVTYNISYMVPVLSFNVIKTGTQFDIFNL